MTDAKTVAELAAKGTQGELTPDLLRELLLYEPISGQLIWRERPVEMFKTPSAHKAWNTRYAGVEAFTSKNSSGYLTGTIFNKPYKAHRVAWTLWHGAWPEGQIDHINGNRSHNWLSNLRDVSAAVNGRNQSFSKANTSGVTGVSWDTTTGKWLADIRVDGKTKYLGRYQNFEEAARVRKRAEREFGYHENHGTTTPDVPAMEVLIAEQAAQIEALTESHAAAYLAGHKDASDRNAELEAWQDISTAPMDGTVVDLWFNDRRFENMRWNDDLGMWQNHARSVLVLMTPTHWMPRPEPPQSGEGE